MLSSLFARALRLESSLSRSSGLLNNSISNNNNNNVMMTTQREKHSSTQIKRLFNKHPARARVEQRMGIIRDEPRVFDAPQFPAVFEPVMLSNGWSAPPPKEEQLTTTYPFAVRRTKNKPMDAVGFLPVYAKYRKDGTKAVTRIKKVTGDQNVFLKELESTLQVPSNEVRIRTGGTIEINGNRVRDVKLWLAGLGF